MNDLRHAVRLLAASPGFTCVSLVSLSLGVAVATCAFTEVNGIILRDVPGVAKPAQLLTVLGPSSYPAYQRYRQQTELFSSTLAYMAPVPFGVSVAGRTERVWGHLVTPSYFATLGVRPALGRAFDPNFEQPGQRPTVVISYRFWQNHLGSDPAIMGKPLRINGASVTVIGVGPRDFQGASPAVYEADLWMPLWVDPRVAPELKGDALERHDVARFQVVLRLRPGVTQATAEAALDTVKCQLDQEFGETETARKGRRVALLPGGKEFPVSKQELPVVTGFLTLLGGMVLLIACANAANMFLARALNRRKEIAIRLSLGAGRFRLIRQLLTESMLVAAVAGVLGFLLSVWIMRGGSQLKLPLATPISFDFSPDGRVFFAALILTALTGIAFGLAPALAATRTDLAPVLKQAGDISLGRRRRLSLRNLLMLSQIAGSLTLLLITGFLVLGQRQMAAVDVGFDGSNLYLVSLDPLRDGLSAGESANFFDKLLDRLPQASLSDSVPMSMIGKPRSRFAAETSSGKVVAQALKYTVDKRYFETIGIPIVRGRGFRKEDETDSAHVAIVSEQLVRNLWPRENPLGRQIEIGSEETPQFLGMTGSPYAGPPAIPAGSQKFEIVGVAKDVRDGLVLVAKNAPPMIYFPLRPSDYPQPKMLGFTLITRAAPGGDPIAAARRQIAAMDSRITPFNARSMSEQIDSILFPVRMATWTYGIVGILGLILASVGLAGVTAYSVNRRRREIGIRMALGARPIDVLALVMKEGVALIAIGSIIGFAFARAGMHALSAFMESVSRTAGTEGNDPALLIGAPLLLAGLALAACYVPARESTRVDPAVTLREE
jgi:macrolide transport system ATP-binding/permease protein